MAHRYRSRQRGQPRDRRRCWMEPVEKGGRRSPTSVGQSTLPSVSWHWKRPRIPFPRILILSELVRRQAGHGGSSAPKLLTSRCYAAGSHHRMRPCRGPLPCPCEQPATARWGGTQASRGLAQGADRQSRGTRCLEGHHPSGSQRVHLLGRGRQAGCDPPTPHSADRGGAGGRPASTLLLARVCAPSAHRQLAVSSVPPSACHPSDRS